MTRHDITPEAVALRWLAGESILSIASDLLVSNDLIKRRLRTAREVLPDLPWDERADTQNRGPTRDYRTMNDGAPGTSVVREGSVVRAFGGVRRGR